MLLSDFHKLKVLCFYYCIDEKFQFLISGSLHCAPLVLKNRFRLCIHLFILCNSNASSCGVIQFTHFCCQNSLLTGFIEFLLSV